MTPPLTLEGIARLYADQGRNHYGEGVSQIEHALQCASLAEAAGEPDSPVVAALLHDIGHLAADAEAQSGAAAGTDDRHEVTGAQLLKGLFGEAVRRPIALHVAAKRYLCAVAPGYFEALSDASKESLRFQGGPFDAAAAAAFAQRPGFREAVALRRLDDAGKSPRPCGRRFEDFEPVMRRLIADGAARQAGGSGLRSFRV